MSIKTLVSPSLNTKLICIIIALNLGLIAMLVFVYYQTEKAIYSGFERRTSEVLKAVQIGLGEATRSGVSDEKRLREYLEKLKLKGVTEISIISNSDRIISSTNPKDVGKWITKNKKELIVKAGMGEPLTGEGQSYLIMVPVVIGEKQMGYIHLQVSAEDISVFLRESLIRRIIGASIILAIGTVFAIVLAQRYTHPIRKTVEAANRIAAGDLDVSLDTRRNDEIGDLARSFNFMIGRLREEKSMRERLRKAEHMATIGEVAHTVAHEIKNPLNFISLSIDHLRETYPPDAPERAARVASLLENMKSEVQRVSRFLGRFLELGKPLGLNLRATDVASLIRSVLDLVAPHAARAHVTITPKIESAPVIQADPELLTTCLYNVIINSFQSMPEGGTLSVSLACDGPRFQIIVADSGMGLSREALGRAFTPYFTTKSDGLGLGLALTKRIVEDHGGRIALASVEGKGTTVTITLPAGVEAAAG